jgi:hypothetical protein
VLRVNQNIACLRYTNTMMKDGGLTHFGWAIASNRGLRILELDFENASAGALRAFRAVVRDRARDGLSLDVYGLGDD